MASDTRRNGVHGSFFALKSEVRPPAPHRLERDDAHHHAEDDLLKAASERRAGLEGETIKERTGSAF